MKINAAQFADLKVRFEKYFQNVPAQIWFTGRRDAPQPSSQVEAVQQMFGIDLTALGGGPVPELEDHIQSRRNRELKVAISRLEQWEAEQANNERRRSLTINSSVEDLEISVRTYHCLKNMGITHVVQLVGLSETELLRTKRFGKTSLTEIKLALAQIGIRLKGSSDPILVGTTESDLDTVVAGIKKLPEDEAREVSLCLLNLFLPFTAKDQAGTDFLCHLRDRLLGE